MVTTKQHLMAMLVLCQDPVIRQFSEVNIVILIFIVEEMAVQTLKMSGCKIQGSVYLKIVLVNDWVVEGCITWSVWGVVDLLLYHWLCDLRETTDISDLIGKMEMIISSLYHRIIDKKQVNIYETVCKR